jgi:undecaprenyl diphosphate synthase
MKDREFSIKEKSEFHVAIIMDGNGRWANQRGKPRYYGHQAGAEVVKEIVETAPELGITTLTLYAFSSDNWNRPPREVDVLMQLFRRYLRQEVKNCEKNGVKLSFIGRRDRIDPALQMAMEAAERTTYDGENIHLRIAIDYSARDMILKATQLSNGQGELTRKGFSRFLAEAQNSSYCSPDVDLLIRTGGEKRLSDFLLWECAYAELYFNDVMWPDFNKDQLKLALANYRIRDRRFGCAKEKAKVYDR